jgi:hypothetical protein
MGADPAAMARRPRAPVMAQGMGPDTALVPKAPGPMMDGARLRAIEALGSPAKSRHHRAVRLRIQILRYQGQISSWKNIVLR